MEQQRRASLPPIVGRLARWTGAAVLPGVGLLAVGAIGLAMLAASVAAMRRAWP